MALALFIPAIFSFYYLKNFFGCSVACGIGFPWPEIEPMPLAVEAQNLITGPPGKFLPFCSLKQPFHSFSSAETTKHSTSIRNTLLHGSSVAFLLLNLSCIFFVSIKGNPFLYTLCSICSWLLRGLSPDTIFFSLLCS